MSGGAHPNERRTVAKANHIGKTWGSSAERARREGKSEPITYRATSGHLA